MEAHLPGGIDALAPVLVPCLSCLAEREFLVHKQRDKAKRQDYSPERVILAAGHQKAASATPD